MRLTQWNRFNTTFEGIMGFYSEDVSEVSGRRRLLQRNVSELLRLVGPIKCHEGENLGAVRGVVNPTSGCCIATEMALSA